MDHRVVALPAQTRLMSTRRRLRGYVSSRLLDVGRGLLQRHSRCDAHKLQRVLNDTEICQAVVKL